MLPMSAQDIIPFMDSCFSQSVVLEWRTGVPVDHSVLASYPYIRSSDLDRRIITYPLPQLIKHINHSGASICGIATMSDQPDLPDDMVLGVFSYNASTGLQMIDSLCGQDEIFHKRMYYTFPDCEREDGIRIVPCNIFLFNKRVNVPDTFYVGHLNLSDYNNGELDPFSYIFYAYSAIPGYVNCIYNTPVSTVAIHEFDYILPILELPCPPAAKPTVTESRQGLVRFNWWEGDTNLYQIAISSYPADSTLFVSDTLTDSTFIVNDSVMAALNLAEGRYYIHLCRACNYMDSPYHSLLWSEWGEGRMFYYSPEREGITSVDEAAPVFALSPNPASQTVTVEVFGVTSQGETRQGEETRQAAYLQIVNLEGRIVAESRLEGEKTDLDVSHLSAGVYLVRLQTPLGSATRKLTIAR